MAGEEDEATNGKGATGGYGTTTKIPEGFSAAFPFLDESHFEAEFGLDWDRGRARVLDFSGEQYALETLEGPREKGNGLLNRHLQRDKFLHVNLSDNRLCDIGIISESHGFRNVLTLKARRNLITQPVLILPKLMELNLSHNELRVLPPLSGVPMIEVLILSHNRIEGTWLILQHSKRLKRIDLSYNAFFIIPSQLSEGLVALAKLQSLVELRLMDNPFVRYFPEYQVFVLKKLKGLHKLDDVKMTSETWKEIEEHRDLLTLDRYDDVFNQRYKERVDVDDKQGGVDVGFPRIDRIIDILEKVMEDPTLLSGNVLEVYNMSVRVYNDSSTFEKLFFSGVSDEGASKFAIERFIEAVQGVMERHDTSRVQLTDMIANFTVISKHKFGQQCMRKIGGLMKGNEESKQEALRAFRDIIVPASMKYKPSHKTSQALIRSIAELVTEHEDLGDKVTAMVPKLIEWCLEAMADNEHVVECLACVSTTKENAVILCQNPDKIVLGLVATIDNRSIAENESQRECWLGVIKIAKNMVHHGDKHVSDLFRKQSLHVKLISRCKAVRGEEATERMKNLDARTWAEMVDLINVLMLADSEVLKECCLAYHVIDELCLLAKQHIADPMMLAAALNGITIVLGDPEILGRFVEGVVEQLSKVTPLLQYLGGKKYKSLYQRAERQMEEKRGEPATQGEIHVPHINALDNILMHRCFVSIIELIDFFTQSENPICVVVSDHLNHQERESILLKLLDVPSDEVKLAVMRCIDHVSLEQLDTEEMGLIIKRLSDTRNIAAGRTEEILSLVIRQLEKLAGTVHGPGGKVGAVFRSKLAELAISSTYDILRRNAPRDTYGQVEEELQKLELSLSVVSFFGTCSKFPELRDWLRNDFMNSTVPEILKQEEEMHSPDVADVAIEQTWTGRSIETNMSCFGGELRLDKRKKVALRCLARIADVLEGRTDSLRKVPTGLSLQAISTREARMWSEQKIVYRLRYLDDQEYQDRHDEAAGFTKANGVGQLLDFISDVTTRDRQAYYKEIQGTSYEFVRDRTEEAENLVALRDEEAAEAKARKDCIVINPCADEDAGKYDDYTGRSVLMESGQIFEDQVDDESNCLFVTLPQDFHLDEATFADPGLGYVNHAYPISAVLRSIHAVLLVPTSDECRREVHHFMKEPSTLAQLLSIMDHAPYLPANVSAKCLRVLSMILELPPGLSEEGDATLILFFMVAAYVKRAVMGLLHLIRQTKDKSLNTHEQTFCCEIARIVATMTSAVPYLRFSTNVEAQSEQVGKCLEALTPNFIVRAFVAIILYDLQMDAGGGFGVQISQDFVKSSYLKSGMKENATTVLARHLVRCPQHKYDVLEAFSAAEVFLNQTVRASYMTELLDRLNMGAYLMHVETFVRTMQGGGDDAQGERCLYLGACQALDPRLKITAMRLLCLTSSKVYLLEVPPGEPPYKAASMGTKWHPGWELQGPRDPILIWSKPYRCISQIYRCFGQQMFAVEWAAETDALGIGIPGGVDVLALNDIGGEREYVLRLLHNLSARREKNRAPIVNDIQLQKEVQSKVQDQVLCATFALRLNANVATPERFSFVVLSPKAFFEFSVSFNLWALPEDKDMAIDAASFLPIDMMEGEDDPDERAPTAKKKVAAAKAYESRMKIKHNKHHSDLDLVELPGMAGDFLHDFEDAAGDMLHEVAEDVELLESAVGLDPIIMKTLGSAYLVQQPLPPTAVHFEPNDEADLILEMGEKIHIRFFDDTAREEWRRGLAYALNKKPEDPKKAAQGWDRSWEAPK